MSDHDYHTIAIRDGKQKVEIKIPVPLSQQDKKRLKHMLPILIDLAIEPPDEPHHA